MFKWKHFSRCVCFLDSTKDFTSANSQKAPFFIIVASITQLQCFSTEIPHYITFA